MRLVYILLSQDGLRYGGRTGVLDRILATASDSGTTGVPESSNINMYFSLIVDNPADFNLTLALNKPKTYPSLFYVDNQL